MLEDYVSPFHGKGWGFNRVPVPRGTSLLGVICGPVRIQKTHWVNEQSKGCRRTATMGAIPCYCESRPVPKRTYGYQPLTLKDGSNIVVTVCESEAKKLKLLPHGHVIEVVAPEVEKTKTYIRSKLDDVMPSSVVQAVKSRAPASIDEWLVYCLWHDQEIMDFFNKKERKEAAPKYPPLVKKKVQKNEPAPVNPRTFSSNVNDLVRGIGLEAPKVS